MVAHNDQPNTRRQTIWRVNLFYTYTNRKWIGDQYEELIGSISSRYKLCVREEKRFGRRKYVENNIYSWGIMTVITVEFKFIFSNFLSLTLFLFFFSTTLESNRIELSLTFMKPLQLLYSDTFFRSCSIAFANCSPCCIYSWVFIYRTCQRSLFQPV